jgi:hypothetical protein
MVYQNPIGKDGCPMFAPAYMGRKRQGEAHQSFSVQLKRVYASKSGPHVKAFENIIFGPRTPHGTPGQVGRNVGHPS